MGKREKKPNRFWTKEECYRAARECGSRSEFRKNCSSGYNVAYKNKWLESYWWFEEKKKPNDYWTKERCYEAACECKTRKEFKEKYGGGYIAALKNNWVDEFFPKNKKSA